MRPMGKNNVLVFTLLLLLFIVSSCGRREAYYQFRELKNGDWAIDQTLLFEIDSATVTPDIAYDISIELTNNVDYPYRNFWISMEVVDGDSMRSEKEIEFVLADEYGKWQGAGFGSLYQSSHTVFERLVFDEGESYKVYIRHKMQDKKLHGIEKVGIKIKESINGVNP